MHKLTPLFVLAPIFLFHCTKKGGVDEGPSDILELSEAETIDLFPGDHLLNQTITSRSVDPNSDAILANIGLNVGLFADFGSGYWEGAPIGIPYVVVGAGQTTFPITYRANDYDENYGDESDPGPYPIPLSAPIEGNGSGDSHVIAVDVEGLVLYELYNASVTSVGWECSSSAKYDLTKNEQRPDGWTSADAAGLPIFPLLVRYEEILTGTIDHPIRFTITRGRIYQGYVRPANHLVTGEQEDDLLPFGAILRLKSDYDISGFSGTNQVILQAMKDHGLMLADVGSNMFISGAPDERWDNDDLRDLRDVKVSDFEVVEMGEILD